MGKLIAVVRHVFIAEPCRRSEDDERQLRTVHHPTLANLRRFDIDGDLYSDILTKSVKHRVSGGIG